MQPDWQLWLIRAAVASIFGVAIVGADRIFSRVQGWRKWLAVFGIPLAIAVVAILAVSIDTALSRSMSSGVKLSVLVISFLFGFACFTGFAFSFVRWIDTWDGRSSRDRKPHQE